MTARGTERLVRICMAAEIRVLRITTPFLSVDLLKQPAVTNCAPERLREPSATMWHLVPKATLVTPLDTCRMDSGPRCSATVYRGGRKGHPGFPPLLLPAPLYTTESEFPVAAGSTPSTHLILPRCTPILTRPCRTWCGLQRDRCVTTHSPGRG